MIVILLAMDTLSLCKGISILGYVLAAVFLIASVAVFFLMDIRGVYSYLSGKKQQKGISEMRQKQENQAAENSRPVPSASSGRIGFAPPPKRTTKKTKGETQYNIKTPPPQQAAPPVSPAEEEATGVLNPSPVSPPPQVNNDEEATGVLNAQNNPANMNSSEAGTDVLSQDNNPQFTQAPARSASKVGKFVIVKEVMEIHTEQVL